MDLGRGIRSELIKYRRSAILWLHLTLPALGAGIFLLYLALYPHTETIGKMALILELTALALPILVAVVCGMAAMLEEKTDQFQTMMMHSTGRARSYLSKLLTLVLLGALSTMLLIGSILGGSIIFSLTRLVGKIFWQAGAFLFLGTIPLYFIHLFLSLKWGLGASVLVGMAESLLVLMFSNAETFTWPFLPCTWAVKFINVRLFAIPVSKAQVVTIVANFIIYLLLSLVWFRRWEGRKSFE